VDNLGRRKKKDDCYIVLLLRAMGETKRYSNLTV